MEDKPKTGLNTGLAITSLVVGIMALLFSFIPCIGAFSLYVAPFAAALGGYAYYISKKTNQPTGLPLGGLIVSLLATAMAGYQAYKLNSTNKTLSRMNNDLYNGRDPFMNNQSSDSGMTMYIGIAIAVLAIGGFIYYYRTRLSSNSSSITSNANTENSQSTQSNFDLAAFIQKNLKIIIAAVAAIIIGFCVWIFFIKADPIGDGKSIANSYCDCDANQSKEMIKVKSEYIEKFSSYNFKTKKEAAEKLTELIRAIEGKYLDCLEKTREKENKKRSNLIGNSDAAAKFQDALNKQRQLCYKDYSYDLSQVETRQWEKLNSLSDEDVTVNGEYSPDDARYETGGDSEPYVEPTPTNNKSVGKYPFTSQRLVTTSDISGKSKAELKIMRNEIFARHGYIFKTQEMKSYFSLQSWYSAQYNDVTSMLSSIEKQNIEVIKKYE